MIKYWCSEPGYFVYKPTGLKVEGCSFTGTTKEWYETLVETMIDLAEAKGKIYDKHPPKHFHFVMHVNLFNKFLKSSILFKGVTFNGVELGDYNIVFNYNVPEDTIELRSSTGECGLIRVLGY